MNNKSQNHKKDVAEFPLLRLALGAALGASAGYMYIAHKEDIDREAKKRVDQVAKMFYQSQVEIEKRVKKIWGEVSKNTIATYLDLRGMLLHQLQTQNPGKTGAMLKKQYDQIVDNVIASARKSGLLSPAIEKGIAEMFKLDWKDMEKMLTKLMITGARETVKQVQKLRSGKKVREVRKTITKAAQKMSTSAKKSSGKAKKTVKKVVKKAVKKVTPKKGKK